ncbi:bifunctional diaminohydroxyphosphoribosylaminopyrimidine deaminase/5-amino-6-(5-phosphoribosylamino)uracil reductase RibD [Pedobacter sp. SYSU D00535]|uniref:bifunctional diaminohydroxyphosphoribosylaminopyrimidine deaminase/5-amino-6-(5-phosphoribosylamino)uracil reductase RibD n=1 Tax=Pedobacter sp. SYSU D00535 TaxID=2810308 RepID=UPI001F601D3D|nr:bifunctional diaminohydroxyphosphoribosylaminopyrimidine deaminase/5-amino-6-(5-phosphoribosylamino)uracil reductase RibD [Pedobacter sp. SYSU D00535]
MEESTVYIRRCLELAALGAGSVSPNPMVGAVIVHHNKIIGEGYHEKYGGPHAEVNAVNWVLQHYSNAESLLKESTIYVSLEPCAHYGKTPPCADLIIRYGIPHVVVSCPDPFEHVNGRGIEKLRAAGVKVEENILREESEFLNRRFFTRVKKQRPYIILKWAQTADKRFAPENGSQRWISSSAAKVLSHRCRTEEDAILIGKNTALIDNPSLTARDWPGRNPKRIVIDRNLELPQNLNLFDGSQETIVFNSIKTETKEHLKFLEVEDFDHYLPQLISYQLYLMDIQSLIVEGGVKTLELFIKAGLWDEARIFTAPDSWGEGLSAPQVSGDLLLEEAVGPDLLQILHNKKNKY